MSSTAGAALADPRLSRTSNANGDERQGTPSASTTTSRKSQQSELLRILAVVIESAIPGGSGAELTANVRLPSEMWYPEAQVGLDTRSRRQLKSRVRLLREAAETKSVDPTIVASVSRLKLQWYITRSVDGTGRTSRISQAMSFSSRSNSTSSGSEINRNTSRTSSKSSVSLLGWMRGRSRSISSVSVKTGESRHRRWGSVISLSSQPHDHSNDGKSVPGPERGSFKSSAAGNTRRGGSNRGHQRAKSLSSRLKDMSFAASADASESSNSQITLLSYLDALSDINSALLKYDKKTSRHLAKLAPLITDDILAILQAYIEVQTLELLS